MITWKYNETPYLDSGDQIYNQMLTSYEAGARYITIFDYPYDKGNEYGTMTNDQFNAMQRFWNDVTQKKFTDLSSPEAVLILPRILVGVCVNLTIPFGVSGQVITEHNKQQQLQANS